MYELDDDEDKDEDEDGGVEVADDDEVRRELSKFNDKAYDPAREGGFSESSSSEESESEEEDAVEFDDDEQEEAELAGQQAEVPMGDVTRRIAAVNMDWDNIRAVDLMAVASSFVPPSGRINSVTVYPSEFGRERIEKEELEGPPREIFANSKQHATDEEDEDSNDESEDEKIKKALLQEDKGDEFDSSALRNYQLQRLRYYYAVITCSGPDTAKSIYDNLDGREYLSSANFFDLRFVPDDTSFDDDKPRDSCSSLPDGYKPVEFKTDALTHSKVRLTWDEDDRERKEAQKRAFTTKEIEADDLAVYVGSDSSDEEEENLEGASGKNQSKAASLRAALGLPADMGPKKKDARPVGNMQVTFSAGLSTGKKGASIFENEPEETTIEKYKRKEKERKAKRKEKARAGRDGTSTTDKPDSVSASKVQDEAEDGEEDDEDPFNDPFFEDPNGPASRAAAKAVKRAKREQKRAEAAAKESATAAERATLELLITDDKDASKMHHFDMASILKAEKTSKKRGKKGRKAVEEVEQDDFQMNVQDPRFAKLYESHEYAIDPTNPRFKRTKAMDAMLEESRKRKDRVSEDGESSIRKEKKRKQVDGDGGDDLRALAEKVKQKTKGAARA